LDAFLASISDVVPEIETVNVWMKFSQASTARLADQVQWRLVKMAPQPLLHFIGCLSYYRWCCHDTSFSSKNDWNPAHIENFTFYAHTWKKLQNHIQFER
jgi:hypothetical protein